MVSIFAIAIQQVPDITIHEGRIIISILDPYARESLFKEDNSVLTLCFGDFIPENFADTDAEFSSRYKEFLIRPDQADQILDFLLANAEKKQLVAQCTGGIARSGAVALFAADVLGISLKDLLKNSPHILPNPYVYDQLHGAAQRKGLKVARTDLSVFRPKELTSYVS